MKPFIVVGDKTSHGGVVIEGSPTNDINGKGIARVGDKVTCPRKGCHSPTTIAVSGDVTIIVDGRPVALHGDKTACGATLISSQFSTNSDPNGGSDSASNANGASSSAAAAITAANSDDEDLEYLFFAERADGSTVNLAYRIDAGSEKLHEGILNSDGTTKAFPMSSTGDITLWIPQA